MQKDLLLDIVEEWRELKATNCQPEPYPQLQKRRIIESSDCRSVCEDVLRAPCPLNTAPFEEIFLQQLLSLQQLHSSLWLLAGQCKGRLISSLLLQERKPVLLCRLVSSDRTISDPGAELAGWANPGAALLANVERRCFFQVGFLTSEAAPGCGARRTMGQGLPAR